MNARVNDEIESEGREVATIDNGMVGLIAAAEIDQQIATAHKYPRSISGFRKEALQLVTLSEVIAQECIYALPRDGKTIQGPSARFAEIILHAWGNSRAGARVVHQDADFITSQGVCHDLQRNNAITFEVQRRITTSKGKRYSPDMIGVTANAASSIALRNAILKVVPKAFWSEPYAAARHCAVGDVKTLANKRADAIAAFQHYGVTEAQIFAKLGRGGVQDITLDDLAILFGILTAIKETEITPEEAFADDAGRSTSVPGPQAKSAAQKPVEPTPKTEEPEREREAPAAQQQPVEQAANADKKVDNDAPLSEGQLRILRAQLKRVALTDKDLIAKFGEISEINFNQFDTIQAWIADRAKNVG